MSFGHQASQKLQEWWILPWAFLYERFWEEKIDLALKFVEFTKKQERSQIKPRNTKVAKRAGNGNAIGIMDTITTKPYYCDVSKWRMARSACWMLLWRFKMAQIWNRPTTSVALGTCTGHPRTDNVTNDSIRKRLLRRRNKKKITRWIEDINFIFSWWKTLFYSLAALVIKILFSPLEKIKFISSCRRVMFLSILYISLLF